MWCGGGGGGARDTRRREGGESRRVRSRARGGRGSSGEARKRVTNAQSSTEQKASSARLSRAFASALLSSLGLHGRLHARVVRTRAKSPARSGAAACRHHRRNHHRPAPPQPRALSATPFSGRRSLCGASSTATTPTPPPPDDRFRPRSWRGPEICRRRNTTMPASSPPIHGRVAAGIVGREGAQGLLHRHHHHRHDRRHQDTHASTRYGMCTACLLHSPCLHMARCRRAVLPAWSHRSTAANQCYLQLDSAMGGA